MTDATAGIEDVEEPPAKKSKGMLFGLVGAVLLGGASFYGVFSGLIPLPFGEAPPPMEEHAQETSNHSAESNPKPEYSELSSSFIPMREIIVSLGPNSVSKHLKLVVSIEVDSEAEKQVEALSPRIRDVLNTFLRAIDERDFEVPRAMTRLRGQMLRRVQLVTPPGAVRDLLIQDFVLN